jgi:hypothetical protein
MNLDQITEQITVYGTKELILTNGKRLCYLIKCEQCGELHYKAQCEIIKGLRRNKKFFCSRACHGKYHATKQEVICANCGINFLKTPSRIAKTNNNFCSKSCAATFNNKNKKFGTRRSKLEGLIETMLLIEYSNLLFSCNQKNVIGSELDFYFPTLKFAIQINGPLHYQPIYGQKKLDQIQQMDKEKRIACQIQKIKLFEINCSQDKYLNKSKIEERLNQIKTILEEGIGLDPNTLAGTAYFPGTVAPRAIHLPYGVGGENRTLLQQFCKLCPDQ